MLKQFRKGKIEISQLSKRKLLWFVAATLILLSVSILIMSQHLQPKPAQTVSYSTSEPSETKPGKDYKWQGGPDDPKKIIIPKLGIDAYVQNVGVDQNKQVAVPNNLYIVGWFTGSVKPGALGLSVIDGHVTGRVNDGVFKNLERLSGGDEYSVQFGNGAVKKFKVTGKKSVPVNDAVSYIFSQDPMIDSQLNLVTCSGNYDANSHSYSERLVVYSEKI